MSTRFPHPEQNANGSLGRKNNMPAARSSNKPFRQPIILVADRLGAGSCQLRDRTQAACYARQPYTVCWIL